jgi:hypothetical protein
MNKEPDFILKILEIVMEEPGQINEIFQEYIFSTHS